MASGSSTIVEHSHHYSKVGVLNPAIAVGTRIEKMARESGIFILNCCPKNIS